jgi:2,3-dihydroxybenzoate decarboxylase/5-carboxyvanillate decarboxylase
MKNNPIRIATEEAFNIPELRQLYNGFSAGSWDTLDARVFGLQSNAESPVANALVDVDDQRLAQMDQLGITMQVLSLTSPGVQLLRPGLAGEMAALANDRLAEAIRRHPGRYCGLAAVAPQEGKRAVDEMTRAIGTLGLNGFIVNSHTNNEYLDDPKYWPILEAAEGLDRPIYLHPRDPSLKLAAAFDLSGMSGPLWGYNTEVSMHVMRMYCAGIFAKFPRLRIVIGHMGETLPFNLWRCDWAGGMARIPGPKFSEVFAQNIAVTTSGAADFANGNASAAPALECTIKAVGADNIMWAIDYPYQPMAPAVKFLDEVDISGEDREKIYHRNAERIFHIEHALLSR